MFPEIDYDFETEEQTDAESLPKTIGRTPLIRLLIPAGM